MTKPENTKNTKLHKTEREDSRELVEKLVELKRTSKKTKGGNRFRFTALMVVGDQNGRVGIGTGKARDVISAIRKGVRKAKNNMFEVPLIGEAHTITHDVRVKYKGAQVLLKPAPTGTGIKAGGAIRTVAEAAGVRNVVGKIIGTDNQKSNIRATLLALENLKPTNQRKVNLLKTKGSHAPAKKPKTVKKETVAKKAAKPKAKSKSKR